MISRLRAYVDIVPYLFFGVCTTGVNVVSYWVAAHLFDIPVMISTGVAWFLAVLFAYVTNRRWVFHSSISGALPICKEIASFFVCRIATGLCDIVCMYLFVVLWEWNDTFVKFFANILVIVLNYILSRYVIFRMKHDGIK